MGLIGNLQDLGLGDILQIVSLSKKSGVLTLDSEDQHGTILFLEGQVVRATSTQFREHLGDILQKYRLIGRTDLEQALAIQSEMKTHHPLGQILSERFGVSQSKIEAAIKIKIERIVYSFFAWQHGVFSFQVDEPESFGSARLNPLDFMLERGLSPQWLASEGQRLASEGRLLPEWPGEGLDDPFDVAPSSLPLDETLVPASRWGDLLIVDDDPETARTLARVFGLAGFDVQTFQRSADFLRACDRAVGKGQAPVLLVDLIMPRCDGHGILGGLEVMELVGQKYSSLPLFLMTDQTSSDASKKAREFGAQAVLNKPGRDALQSTTGIEMLQRLVTSIRSLGAAESLRLDEDLLVEDRFREQTTPHTDTKTKAPTSPGLYLLKGMLQELSSPLLGSDIILLILRFASEILNRAVIFDVRDKTLVGLGQFGLEGVTENADQMVRTMRLQVTQDSVLSRALQQKVPLTTRLGSGKTDRALRTRLHVGETTEVFIGPLVSEGRVVALIYGDNLPEGKPIEDHEAFEVFLSQAGMAMEKVLLERRLDHQVAAPGADTM